MVQADSGTKSSSTPTRTSRRPWTANLAFGPYNEPGIVALPTWAPAKAPGSVSRPMLRSILPASHSGYSAARPGDSPNRESAAFSVEAGTARSGRLAR